MHSVRSVVVFAVLVVAAVTAHGPITIKSNLTKTHRTEDYITQNLRQNAAIIKKIDTQLDEFKARYNSRMDTLAYQKELVELKIDELEAELNSLESINELNKHCVQKYRYQIATVSSVRESLSSCETKRISYLTTILAAPEATVRSLKLFHSAYVTQYLENCRTQNVNSRTNYTLCATAEIQSAATTTYRDMKNFQNQMKQATCSSSQYVQITADCSFNIVYSTVSAIGATMRLIDTCIDDFDSLVTMCPPCSAVSNDCVQHDVTAVEFQNATITNPLAGYNSFKCLQLNVVPSDSLV